MSHAISVANTRVDYKSICLNLQQLLLFKLFNNKVKPSQLMYEQISLLFANRTTMSSSLQVKYKIGLSLIYSQLVYQVFD